MDNPIMLSPHDLFNLFLAACGAIVAVAAAVTVIIKVVEHFKQPNKMQDQRIAGLEEDVKVIKERLAEGDKHFSEHDERFKDFEMSLKKRDMVMIESLQALIAHSIDGNNIDAMKEQKHKLDKYLLER